MCRDVREHAPPRNLHRRAVLTGTGKAAINQALQQLRGLA